MRHKSRWIFLFGLLAVLLVQTARAQGTEVVPFQEQTDQMQGAILMVENNVLYLERNGIPYTFNVNAATHIMVGSQPANLEALAARKGQMATVKFRVTRKGNMAQEVALGGTGLSWMHQGMMQGMHEQCFMWKGNS